MKKINKGMVYKVKHNFVFRTTSVAEVVIGVIVSKVKVSKRWISITGYKLIPKIEAFIFSSSPRYRTD